MKLIEVILSDENLKEAIKRVKSIFDYFTFTIFGCFYLIVFGYFYLIINKSEYCNSFRL